MSAMNQKIIEEFRSNDGVVGGHFEGHTLLLLHHQGAKSGAARLTPVMYRALDDGYAIFASNNGQDSNPAWYYNLLAHPETRVEVGTEMLDVTAAGTHQAVVEFLNEYKNNSVWGEVRTEMVFA